MKSVGAPVNTSSNMESGEQLKILEPKEVMKFRSLVVKLLFLTNTVRLDLAYAVNQVSRDLSQPKQDEAAAKHVISTLLELNIHLPGLIYWLVFVI
ncbi:uncharacterized protein KGF55_002676 [Candida pseudojiufengensis]|uniref:uncharacterized protein n=1 Tax=Candida pseudojiufengensis TaxID=497109 RepID=UPI0022240A82|nr:uncharacterized protein KGF55_002676 [Candida pseudojiufengensis]KAI5963796.1 hypothetical protein KGF55_002676 [Candida pseudojiufengensis]